MKVCIVTVINTPNYGAVLQAYALQEKVNQLGYDCDILNYYNKFQETKFSFWGKNEKMSKTYIIAKKLLYPIRKNQLKVILKYQNEKINLTKRVTSENELKSISETYDIFICGSDQIWNNSSINNYNPVYFLSFVSDKKKIAYAPSFAKEYDSLTKKDIDFYKKYINQIDEISVREDSGAEIVYKITGKEVPVVCDPTFLLDMNQWNKQTVQYNRKKKFIFVFLLGNSANYEMNKLIVKKARKIVNDCGYETKILVMGLSSVLFKNYQFPSVEQWISLIRDAEFVFTNSFHGSAFSIIFEKEFYSFIDNRYNDKENTRIINLMNRLGIVDRVIDINNLDNFERKKIDYVDCKRTMDQWIEFSSGYLKNTLNK